MAKSKIVEKVKSRQGITLLTWMVGLLMILALGVGVAPLNETAELIAVVFCTFIGKFLALML